MRLPKLLRHASGQGVVRIAGRDYYCGKFDDPRCETKYKLLLAEWLSNRNSFSAHKTEVRTFEDIAVAYLEHAKGYYESREFNNIRLVVRVVLRLYGDHLADDFGSAQFKTVRSTLLQEGNNRSRQYVNKCMRLLVRMLKWCTGEGLIDPKVLATVREIDCLKVGHTEAPESEPVHEVGQSIVEATIAHLPQVVIDMIRLQQLLGCRPGELCQLKPSLIDRSRQVWEVRLKRHKTAHRGKQRTIFVGPKAQAILKPYLSRDPDSYCFSPAEAVEQRRAAAAAARVTPASCGNARGRRGKRSSPQKPKARYSKCYTTASYGQAIKYACRQAWPAPKGLDKAEIKAWNAAHSWAPNQLRHSAGTEIREAFGLEHVAAVLGHSDISTSKIYAKLDRDKAIEAAMTR
jgi:integrase